jgi:hypothetical protein
MKVTKAVFPVAGLGTRFLPALTTWPAQRQRLHLLRLLHLMPYPVDTAAWVFCREPTGD